MPITIKRRTFYLLVIMLLVTLIATGISIILMYNVVVDQKKDHLKMLCENQASLIKSILKETNDEKKIISILNNQFDYTGGMFKTGEFAIARMKDDTIRFVTLHRFTDLSKSALIPPHADYGIPIQFAMAKYTGFIVGKDYRNVTVLSYCTYIPELGWGIVAKMDMTEVNEPFYKAGLYTGLSALLLVLIGVLLFRRISDPILKRIIHSEHQMSLVTDNIPTKIAYIDKDLNFLFVNQNYADWRSKSKEDILGKKIVQIVREEEYKNAYPQIQKVFSGEPVSFSTSTVNPDGSLCHLDVFYKPEFNHNNEVSAFYILINDVTEKKRAEDEKQITIGFLSLVNRSKNTTELVRSAVTFFQEHSGCEAVGIRLKEDDDYPYNEAHGFPDEFIKTENSLCGRNKEGEIIRDYTGNPVIDCMCGNVICGRFDPSKSFFTEGGSFWSNNTTKLLATTTDADRQARTRNRCNGEGYESVALIPIQVGKETLGLIQLNDKRKGRFSIETINLWERLSGSLAISLLKLKSDEELSKSQEWFKVTLSSIGDAVICCDKESKITFINPIAEALTGWHWRTAMKEPIGNVFKIINEDTGTVSPDIIERVLREQRIIGLANHTALTSKDGHVIPIEDSAAPIIDNAGNLVGAVLVFHDVTKRRKAEMELQEAMQRENFLANLVRNASIAVGIGYPDGSLGMVNTAFQKLTGYSEQELKSINWNTVLTPPEWVDYENKKLTELQNNKRSVQYEKEYIRKDGSRVPIELIVHPFFDKAETVTHYYSFINDISERKKAEEKIRKDSILLNQAGSLAKLGGWEINVATMKQTWTDETYVIHEVDKATYDPNVDAEISKFAPEAKPLIEKAVYDALNYGTSYDLELEFITAKGNHKMLRCVGSGEKTGDKVTRVYGIVQDITEQKKVEELLKRQVEMVQISYDAIIVWQVGGAIENWNKGAEELYGYTKEEAIGQVTHELLKTIHPEPWDKIDKKLHERKFWEGELRHHTRDGREIIVSARHQLITDAKGVERVLEINRDITEQKKVEMALRESEERFATTLSSIGDAVISTDMKGNITFLNHVAEELTGWKLKDALQKPVKAIFNIVNEYTRKEVESPVDKVLEKGLIVGLANHTVLIRRDGTETPIDDSGAPIKDKDGNTLGVVLVFRDISVRKKAEESRIRLASIIEHSHDAVISKDMDGKIISWNEGAEKIFGYSASEAIGQNISMLIPPGHKNDEPEILEKIKRGEPIENHETERMRKDGKIISISVSISPVKDYYGRIIGASKIVTDITERKKAEDALHKSEENYRNLFNTLIEGYCVIEMVFDAENKPVDYRFLEINKAFENQTGLHNAQGRLMRDLAPDHEAHWFEIYGKIALTGKSLRFENEAKALGRHYDVHAYRVGGQESRKVAILFSDITERKLAEENLKKVASELQELLITKDKFFRIISHDLRNSFSGLYSGSEYLAENIHTLSADRTEKLSTILYTSAKRSFNIIENLSTWSRSQSGSIESHPEGINLSQMVAENISSLEANAFNKKIKILSKVDENVNVNADKNMLNTILFNLINNGVKFTPKGGKITIQAQENRDHVTIAVKDTGVGMSKEDLDKLFRIDVKYSNQGTEGERGTGWGLILCKEFIEKSGGEIWVESETGKGSEVKFTLPVSKVTG